MVKDVIHIVAAVSGEIAATVAGVVILRIAGILAVCEKKIADASYGGQRLPVCLGLFGATNRI